MTSRAQDRKIGQADPRPKTQDPRKQTKESGVCVCVAWVALHLRLKHRRPQNQKSIAAPECPGSDTAAIRGSVYGHVGA